MFYVYVIQSVNESSQVYVGYTESLKERIDQHNSGQSTHTAKYMPWKLVMYLAFKGESKAVEFEKYLKSGSGKVFLRQRLL